MAKVIVKLTVPQAKALLNAVNAILDHEYVDGSRRPRQLSWRTDVLSHAATTIAEALPDDHNDDCEH